VVLCGVLRGGCFVWLVVWLFCGEWLVCVCMGGGGVGVWFLHCFEVLMHVLWLGDFVWCLCGWGLVLTIVIAGLVKRVFEDFFLWSVCMVDVSFVFVFGFIG
jgi:hypothetical protein